MAEVSRIRTRHRRHRHPPLLDSILTPRHLRDTNTIPVPVWTVPSRMPWARGAAERRIHARPANPPVHRRRARTTTVPRISAARGQSSSTIMEWTHWLCTMPTMPETPDVTTTITTWTTSSHWVFSVPRWPLFTRWPRKWRVKESVDRRRRQMACPIATARIRIWSVIADPVAAHRRPPPRPRTPTARVHPIRTASIPSSPNHRRWHRRV